MAAALECRARGLGHTGHMGHAHHSPSGHPAASIACEQHPEHAIPAALWCLVPHLGRSPPLEPFAFGAGLRLRSALFNVFLFWRSNWEEGDGKAGCRGPGGPETRQRAHAPRRGRVKFHMFCSRARGGGHGCDTCRVGIQNSHFSWLLQSPESVETLTVQLSRLQLHSLEPLGVCTRLKRLDLSRNTIRSLAGAEFLAQLESLNLYGNKLGDLGELLRLRQLPSLADVDLRMNPVVNHDSYRLFAIKYLPRTMRRLDGSEISALQRSRAESLFANLDCSSSSSGDDSDHVLDEHKEAPDQQENIHPGQLAPALPPDPTRVDRKDKHLLPSHVGGLAEQPRDPVCGILCTQGMPGALGASNVTGQGHVDALEMVAPDSEILFEHRIKCEIDKLPETEELALLKRQLVPALRRSDCPESEVRTEAVGIAQGELEKPAENKEDCECIKGASGSEGEGGNLQAQLQPTPFMFQTSSETAAVGREVRAEVERLVQEQRKRVTELEARLTASQQEARAYLTRAVDAESRAAAAEAQVARVTERAGDGEAERSLVEMLKESHRVLMSDSHVILLAQPYSTFQCM